MATSDIHALAGMPVDLEMGGRTYKVGRLSILDILGEFGGLVRSRRLSDIITASRGIADRAERQEMVKALMRDMPRGREVEEEARQLMDTVEGGVRILWMALRKGQPEITMEDATALATGPGATEVAVAVEYAMGADLEEIRARQAQEAPDPKK